MGPSHVENVMDLACRTALVRQGVAHVTMPVDMQSLPLNADRRSERNVRDYVSTLEPGSTKFPAKAQVEYAAKILNEGQKICILAGRGALNAKSELAAGQNG